MVLEMIPESPLDRKEMKPILREINTEYSLEGLMLKLKLQYFDYLMGTADSLEKSLMLGKIEGRKRRQCGIGGMGYIFLYMYIFMYSCCSSIAQTCPTLCDPMDCSTPGSSVLHCLLEFAQTYVH